MAASHHHLRTRSHKLCGMPCGLPCWLLRCGACACGCGCALPTRCIFPCRQRERGTHRGARHALVGGPRDALLLQQDVGVLQGRPQVGEARPGLRSARPRTPATAQEREELAPEPRALHRLLLLLLVVVLLVIIGAVLLRLHLHDVGSRHLCSPRQRRALLLRLRLAVAAASQRGQACRTPGHRVLCAGVATCRSGPHPHPMEVTRFLTFGISQSESEIWARQEAGSTTSSLCIRLRLHGASISGSVESSNQGSTRTPG